MENSDKHKFQEDSGMSFEDVFGFVYKATLLPTMQTFIDELGRDRVIEILKKSASESAAQMGKIMAGHLPNNDFETFKQFTKNPDHFWKHVWTFEIVEDSGRAFEVKASECIWTKIFRECNATDIGYARICHSDFAMCRAFNPKIKMIRTKTLMQRDDCCNHRWVLEE